MARLRSYNTGSGAMSVTLNPGYGFNLEEVRLHLSAAASTSENFTIDVDANEGSAYDVNLLTKDMATIQDVLWQLDSPIKLVNGDKVVFAYTNTDSRTWGLEVIYTRQTY